MKLAFMFFFGFVLFVLISVRPLLAQAQQAPSISNKTVQTQSFQIVNVRAGLDKNTGMYSVAGTVSQPLFTVIVWTQKTGANVSGTTRYRAVGTAKANQKGEFNITIDPRLFETDEQVLEIEAVNTVGVREISKLSPILVSQYKAVRESVEPRPTAAALTKQKQSVAQTKNQESQTRNYNNLIVATVFLALLSIAGTILGIYLLKKSKMPDMTL